MPPAPPPLPSRSTGALTPRRRPGPDDPLRIAYLTYRGKPHVGGQGVYTRHLTKALVDLGHHVEVLSGQPYPIVDERVPLVELPSLDIYNDYFPMRMPGVLGAQGPLGLARGHRVLHRHLPRAAGLLACGRGTTSRHRRRRLRPGAGQPVPRLRPAGHGAHGPAGARHHPPPHHGRPPPRDGARRDRAAALVQGPLVRLHQDADPGGQAPAAGHHRVARTPTTTSAATTWCRPRSSSSCPVGVDPELFVPIPGIERNPNQIIIDGLLRRGHEGPALPARGPGQAPHRPPRAEAGDGRHASRRAPPRSARSRSSAWATPSSSSRASPTSASSSSTTSRRCAVVPSLYEGFSLPAIEAMSTRLPAGGHHRRRHPRGGRPRRRDLLHVPPGRQRGPGRRHPPGPRRPRCGAQRIGAAGRERVINRWSWRHTAVRTVEHYRALLEDAAANPWRS